MQQLLQYCVYTCMHAVTIYAMIAESGSSLEVFEAFVGDLLVESRRKTYTRRYTVLV